MEHESNESTEFTEKTSKKKPARRKDEKGISEEMNEQTTETEDLLDYDVEKDGYA
jgi:hypothetical protein